ncbi:MAG TPA: ATP-binding protein [Microvirga sp.]|jgi:PAS domain S-box-containing protein
MSWLFKRPTRHTLLTAVAAVSLIGCLVFAGVRLLQTDRALRRLQTSTDVWHVMQAQYEMALFSQSLARQAAGEVFATPEDAPPFRFDIMMSRIEFLMEGPQLRALQNLAPTDELVMLHRQVASAEQAIEAGLSPPEALSLAAQAIRLGDMLRGFANTQVHRNRVDNARNREYYLRIVYESMASVLGIIVSAGILAFRLWSGLRETKQAQTLLRQEQEFSELVIDLSNQGIVILDQTLTCLLWNPGMEALLEAKAENVVGRPVQSVLPIFRSPRIEAAMLQAMGGASSMVEDESLTPQLQLRCLEISCHPLRMSGRNLVIAFVRDITERWRARKEAEQQNVDLEMKVQQRTAALRQAESRLVAAIKTASDGFAAFDSEGRLLIANERIRSIEPVVACYREDMSLKEFLRCLAACEGADERLLADDDFGSIELDLRLSPEVWAHLSVQEVDGGTIFVRLTDVTPYKKAALALQSALTREREITSAYRTFVSMVSHQFRTPLAIVDSTAQRLLRKKGVSDEELSERVQKIRNATSRLTRLVDSVLNAAKLDAGQITVNPTACDLVELVSDICERQRELTPSFDIRLIAPPHPLVVTCDTTLVEQVVVNLISNAVKYSTKAERIDVKLWSGDQSVNCSVSDWGLGIPADEQGKIFDRFYRARTAAGIAGTGIGLNLARQIIRMHGGEIRVDSLEGQGSTFVFTLPAISAAQKPQAA